MDLTLRPASLDGTPGALIGRTAEGPLWQAELTPQRCSALLRASAAGAVLELCSEGGRTRAQIRRCSVEVVDGLLRVRLQLALRASA